MSLLLRFFRTVWKRMEDGCWEDVVSYGNRGGWRWEGQTICKKYHDGWMMPQQCRLIWFAIVNYIPARWQFGISRLGTHVDNIFLIMCWHSIDKDCVVEARGLCYTITTQLICSFFFINEEKKTLLTTRSNDFQHLDMWLPLYTGSRTQFCTVFTSFTNTHFALTRCCCCSPMVFVCNASFP